MRACRWLAALVFAVAVAGPVLGQFTVGNSSTGSFAILNPKNSATQPLAAPMTISSTTGSFLNLFRTVNPISTQRSFGSSSFPTSQDLNGREYLRYFWYQRPARQQY